MQIDEDTAFNIRTKIEAIIRGAKAALNAARIEDWETVKRQLSLAENDIGFIADDMSDY